MSTAFTNTTKEDERKPRKPERILVVDTDDTFRENLAQKLAADGHDVLTADAGRQAFALLRDQYLPIGWLYSRASLDSLIDGWILADEYHSRHPERPAFIATPDARSSASGDMILRDPTPFIVAGHIRRTITAAQAWDDPDLNEQSRAA